MAVRVTVVGQYAVVGCNDQWDVFDRRVRIVQHGRRRIDEGQHVDRHGRRIRVDLTVAESITESRRPDESWRRIELKRAVIAQNNKTGLGRFNEHHSARRADVQIVAQDAVGYVSDERIALHHLVLIVCRKRRGNQVGSKIEAGRLFARFDHHGVKRIAGPSSGQRSFPAPLKLNRQRISIRQQIDYFVASIRLADRIGFAGVEQTIAVQVEVHGPTDLSWFVGIHGAVSTQIVPDRSTDAAGRVDRDDHPRRRLRLGVGSRVGKLINADKQRIRRILERSVCGKRQRPVFRRSQQHGGKLISIAIGVIRQYPRHGHVELSTDQDGEGVVHRDRHVGDADHVQCNARQT